MLTAQLSGLVPASVAKFADKQSLANQTAIITIPAVPNKRIIIQGIQGSYSAAPTGGMVHITDGADTFFEIDITVNYFEFHPILAFPVGSGVVITLAAGGGTTIGKLNAQWIEYIE